MFWSKRITRFKAVELTMFVDGWSCIIDFNFSWTIGRKHDHAGFMLCFVLFGYKIIDFGFYDTRHSIGE